MLKKIALTLFAVVVLAVAGLVVAAALAPDTFRVARSVTVNAPPERVFPLINSFQQMKTWSPYETKDPGMKRTFSGPAAGAGAAYAWDGNGDVGAGVLTIDRSEPDKKVVMTLAMKRPFEGSNTIVFSLVPKGAATEVTWDMSGRQPFLAKVMCQALGLFVSMDEMIGRDFETGLASLKAMAERPA